MQRRKMSWRKSEELVPTLVDAEEPGWVLLAVLTGANLIVKPLAKVKDARRGSTQQLLARPSGIQYKPH
jgi:hypothetical protein